MRGRAFRGRGRTGEGLHLLLLALYEECRWSRSDCACYGTPKHIEASLSDNLQMAKFPKEQVKVKQGLELIKTWVLNDTMSGSEKHKLFCGRCGCTLWTIPMSHGGTHFIVRTSLIDNGYVT